jgi:hypothetical protein
MDKPVTLSVKNFLIRKLSTELMVPEKTIEAIVNHQMVGALDAFIKYKTVEISGFGRFVFNDKKALKLMQKYHEQVAYFEKTLKEELSPQRRGATEAKLRTTLDNIKFLTPKLKKEE